MKKLLVLLAAGSAAFIFKDQITGWFGATPTPAPAGTPATPLPPNQTTPPAPQIVTPPAPSVEQQAATATTKDLMLNYITKIDPGIVPSDGLFPYDNWAWIETKVRGTAPSWESVSASSFLRDKDRAGYRMTFEEYWRARNQSGLGALIAFVPMPAKRRG